MSTALAGKPCGKKRPHTPHAWWSRIHKRYFRCAGRST